MIIIRQTAQLLSETEVFSKAISNLGLQKNSARAKKKHQMQTETRRRETEKKTSENGFEKATIRCRCRMPNVQLLILSQS